MGCVRRSGRIAKEIRILLSGMDLSGQLFSEETRTVTLSRHGAGLISRHKLAPDGILMLRFLGGRTEAAIRLVGQLGEDGRGYVYGVAFEDPTLDFWELTFPPPPKWRVDFHAPLQCTSCQTREVVDQSEVEADVYALAESILRFCRNCQASTQWRRAGEALAAPAKTPAAGIDPHDPAETSLPGPESRLAEIEIAVPAPAEPPPAVPANAPRAANRRRDVRTRVSLTACVRCDSGEEIVECGNISKGGFSFRSRKVYLAGSMIDAAVPHYPGTQSVFVAASIRHARELPNSNYHYGVMYSNPAKTKT
jgi:hypothetical protein